MAKKNIYVNLDLNKQQLLNAVIDNEASAPLSPVEGLVYFNTVSKKYFGWNGTAWIDLSVVVTGVLTIKGEITNASSNPSYPSTPTTGDTWFITTTSGTVGGTTVEIGDQLIYGSSSWFVVQKNLDASSETVAGYIRIATQAEVNASSLDSVAVTPLKLATFLINKSYVRSTATVITSLVANTPTTVTHGLGLSSAYNVIVQCYQGGEQIELRVAPSSVNAIQVESNVTLASVTINIAGSN